MAHHCLLIAFGIYYFHHKKPKDEDRFDINGHITVDKTLQNISKKLAEQQRVQVKIIKFLLDFIGDSAASLTSDHCCQGVGNTNMLYQNFFLACFHYLGFFWK